MGRRRSRHFTVQILHALRFDSIEDVPGRVIHTDLTVILARHVTDIIFVARVVIFVAFVPGAPWCRRICVYIDPLVQDRVLAALHARNLVRLELVQLGVMNTLGLWLLAAVKTLVVIQICSILTLIEVGALNFELRNPNSVFDAL